MKKAEKYDRAAFLEWREKNENRDYVLTALGAWKWLRLMFDELEASDAAIHQAVMFR